MAKKEKKRVLHVFRGRPPFPGLLPHCPQSRGSKLWVLSWPLCDVRRKWKGCFRILYATGKRSVSPSTLNGFSYLLLRDQHDQSCCVIAVYISCQEEYRFPGYPSSCWSSSPSSAASPLTWAYWMLLPVSWKCFAIALGPMVSDQQNLLYSQQSLNSPFTFFLLQTESRPMAWLSL